MAIKNKDGTIYKLRGPNPLMTDQTEWDRQKVRLHNFGWKSEVVQDERNPVKEAAANVLNIRDELKLKDNPKTLTAKEFLKEINEPPVAVADVPVETAPVVEEPKEEEVVLNVEPKLARLLKQRGVEFYCAPAVGERKHTDSLYGSSYETTVYGDQFVFDGVVIDHSDLQLQFWCVRAVTKNSVVLRKIKEGGERWWRVIEVEPKTGGYLVLCVTSDSNPDFSPD